MQGTRQGARRRGRPRTAWIDNIKTWTGLSMEESVRMTEDRDKWRKCQLSDRGRLKNRTEPHRAKARRHPHNPKCRTYSSGLALMQLGSGTRAFPLKCLACRRCQQHFWTVSARGTLVSRVEFSARHVTRDDAVVAKK